MMEISESRVEYILSLNACKLLKAIRDMQVSCEEAVTIYIRRLHKYGRELNLTTVEYFEDALATARRYDIALRQDPTAGGPLMGLPITVKDNFHIEGSPCSAGVARLCLEKSTFTAPVIQSLIDAGAIILAKGNVP